MPKSLVMTGRKLGRLTETLAYPVGSPGGAVPGRFALTGVGQAVAVAAGEDFAAVQDGDTSTASAGRAQEPRALSAEMAPSPVQINRIELVFPVPTANSVAINQHHPAGLGAHLDGCHYFAAPRPLQTERLTGAK